ncbi:hypothetical protein ACRRTK_023670 [Alexandromys fortis]
MGALKTAGKVTFLPDDSPFSEYTNMRGWVQAMTGRGESHAPLNPAAPCFQLLLTMFLLPSFLALKSVPFISMTSVSQSETIMVRCRTVKGSTGTAD